MGQKSNLISLRKNINKSLTINTTNSNLFVKSLNFLNFFEKFCSAKNILISSNTFNFVNNQIFFNFDVFYRTNLLMYYKKKSFLKKKTSFLEKKNNSIIKLFFKSFILNKKNVVFFNLNNLNKFFYKRLYLNYLKQFYVFNKRFMHLLFDRRLNLFIDFLKTSVLFLSSKISIKIFLFIIGQIFKNIPKSKHTKFLLFVRELFRFMTKFKNVDETQKIKGLKLIINGKLKGKTRASSTRIESGSIPIQSLDKRIEFSKLHVYTRYGAFGFQLWVFFQ